jgi:hypothetical protein
MIIRFTKATKFMLLCALLVLSAVISIGTKTITVSQPITASGAQPLPMLVYRLSGAATPNVNDVRDDLEYLHENSYTILSERDLLASLRSKTPLPSKSVVLLFEDGGKTFREDFAPELDADGASWFPLSKIAALMQELRVAGYPCARLERSAVFSPQDYFDEYSMS